MYASVIFIYKIFSIITSAALVGCAINGIKESDKTIVIANIVIIICAILNAIYLILH